MSEKNYQYETKCRRCGTFEIWHFASVSNIVYDAFRDSMDNHIQFPRTYMCEKCNKATVQDIVYYSPNGGE